MALALTTLVSRTGTKIADIARAYPNEIVGTGDASITVFYVNYPPVKDCSQTVYIDGIAQTETSHYTIDNDMGKIIFVAAPSANTQISVDYIGLYLSDTDLTDLVTLAVEDLVLYYPVVEFTVSGGNVSPVPSQVEEGLLLRQASLSVIEAEMLKTTRDAVRTARTGVSIDTTARPKLLTTIAEMMRTDLTMRSNRTILKAAHSLQIDELKR